MSSCASRGIFRISSGASPDECFVRGTRYKTMFCLHSLSATRTLSADASLLRSPCSLRVPTDIPKICERNLPLTYFLLQSAMIKSCFTCLPTFANPRRVFHSVKTCLGNTDTQAEYAALQRYKAARLR